MVRPARSHGCCDRVVTSRSRCVFEVVTQHLYTSHRKAEAAFGGRASTYHIELEGCVPSEMGNPDCERV